MKVLICQFGKKPKSFFTFLKDQSGVHLLLEVGSWKMEVGFWMVTQNLDLKSGSWIWKLDLKVGNWFWKLEVGNWKLDVHISHLSLTCLKQLNMVRNAAALSGTQQALWVQSLLKRTPTPQNSEQKAYLAS